MHLHTLTLAACGLISTPLLAQVTFETAIGTAVTPSGDSDEVVIGGLPLGFPFTFPGGVTTNSVDVSVNGRVFPAGMGATSSFSSDLTTFLNGLPAIAPYFRDQQFTDPATDALYFNGLPGKAVFTWRDAAEFSSSSPYTYQCQLFADGRVQFVYDDRIATTLGDAVVGLTSGGGATDPGASDLASAPGLPIATAGIATVYEAFTAIGVPVPFDLVSFGLEFQPDGAGGWNVDGTAPPVARVERTGDSCGRAIDFFPDGFGGYVVLRSSAPFDTNFGTSIGVLSDDSASAPLNLGFAFPFPGGMSSSTVVVTDNGRILLPGTESQFFLPPTPFFLQAQPFPVIAPFWSRFDPTAGGDVLLLTGPGFATITWQDVVQSGESATLTFQATLADGGGITFRYFSTEQFVTNSNTAMVGLSAGNVVGAGPPEVDFGALPILNGGSTIYEFIDTTFGGGEDNTLQLGLSALSLPALGTSYDLQLNGIENATVAAFLLLGFGNPDADLNLVPAVGLPNCRLLTTASIGIGLAIQGTTSSVLNISISTDPALIGVPIFAQGATVVPEATPLGLVLSNGVLGVVGL